MTSDGFEASLRKFFGKASGHYISDGPLWKQAFDALHGPPQRPVGVNDLLLFGACVAHDCPDKGAVVLDRGGAIVGVALIFSSCSEIPKPQECFNQYRLAIFQHRQRSDPEAVEALRAWAFRQGPAVAESLAASGRAHPPRIITM